MVWLIGSSIRVVASASLPVASIGSRRARSRSSRPRPRAGRPPAASRPDIDVESARLARPPARTRAAPGAGRPGRRHRAAGRDHRLVEPVGVDRVVDVVHRVELLRPDGDGRSGPARGGTSPRSTRSQPDRRRLRCAEGRARTRPGSGSAPRAPSSRTQSMWTSRDRHASPRRRTPSGGEPRRDASPRPVVVPTSSVPTPIGARTSTSAARTSQVRPRSAYHAR